VATVLIIEDNPHNMKLASFLLENAGYTVLQASDAQAGIALARMHRPDIILMDIQLPGMDGLAATQVIKADAGLRHSKVFALTAFAMKGDEDKIRAAGCDGYIAKPFNYRTFLETIAAALPAGATVDLHGE